MRILRMVRHVVVDWPLAVAGMLALLMVMSAGAYRYKHPPPPRLVGWPDSLHARAERLGWDIGQAAKEMPSQLELVEGHVLVVTFANPAVLRDVRVIDSTTAKKPELRRLTTLAARAVAQRMGEAQGGPVDRVDVVAARVPWRWQLIRRYDKRDGFVIRQYDQGAFAVLQAGPRVQQAGQVSGDSARRIMPAPASR